MKNLFLCLSKGEGKIIPEGTGKPGHVYTVGRGDSGMDVYKIETEGVKGSGKFERSGLGNSREAKENTLTAFNYLKAFRGHKRGYTVFLFLQLNKSQGISGLHGFSERPHNGFIAG